MLGVPHKSGGTSARLERERKRKQEEKEVHDERYMRER